MERLLKANDMRINYNKVQKNKKVIDSRLHWDTVIRTFRHLFGGELDKKELTGSEKYQSFDSEMSLILNKIAPTFRKLPSRMEWESLDDYLKMKSDFI